MTTFATFALLYMSAIFLELAERWRYPELTATVLLLILAFLVLGITRRTFLVFLAVTTAHFVLVQFPDVANHVNIAIYCNLLLMLGIGYSLIRSRQFPTDDDCFEMMRPVLQVSLILVYALAGFHKLNADFLTPGVSCVGEMAASLARMARSRPGGIPAGLVLLAGISMVSYGLLSSSPLRRHLPLVHRAGVVCLVLVAVLLVARPSLGVPDGVTRMVVLGMAVMVILWELVGGALLTIPRLQAVVLAFSWSMHATLALIGFVDFGALALSLLFAFIPRPYAELLNRPVSLRGVAVHRAHGYLAFAILSGIASGLGRRLLAGLLFNAGALVLIWPLLSAALSPALRPAWTGVPLTWRRRPAWMLVFPVVLLLHGLTSYLGLRTAGNFTMFSNLRTEGDRSNHLLLASNPLKLWPYQEDVVRFIAIDDRRARIGYQYQPLEGNRLPVVEFRKLIHRWTRAGAKIPLRFEYRGRVYSTEDIVNDPQWRAAGRDWEMRLLDFRVIQGEGPNRCRW